MNKLFIIILLLLTGCKDKYEKALDEVRDNAIPVRKCELKKLAYQKPDFQCGEIEHDIAIEKAKALGIKYGRILAAINIGKLQTDQKSQNLIRISKYLKIATEYKTNSKNERQYFNKYTTSLDDFRRGINLDLEDFAPSECRKYNFIFKKSLNEDYDAINCVAILNELKNQSEKASIIWAEKAAAWEKAAANFKPEY